MKKIILTFILIVVLGLATAVFVLVPPALEEQERDEGFAIDMSGYTYIDMEKFLSGTQEIKQYMDNDDFANLKRELGLLAELKIQEEETSTEEK